MERPPRVLNPSHLALDRAARNVPAPRTLLQT